MKQFHFVPLNKNVTLEKFGETVGKLSETLTWPILKYLMKDLGHRLSLGNDHIGEFQ